MTAVTAIVKLRWIRGPALGRISVCSLREKLDAAVMIVRVSFTGFFAYSASDDWP